jgi:hypothetical protein
VHVTSDQATVSSNDATADSDGTAGVTITIGGPLLTNGPLVSVTGLSSGRTASVVVRVQSDVLLAGNQLLSSEALYSASGQYWAYVTHGSPEIQTLLHWRALSPAYDVAGGRLVMQTDGNLVAYSPSTGRALWASGTNGTGSHNRAVLGDDGTLRVYSGSNVVWASRTAGSTLASGAMLRAGQFLDSFIGERLTMQANGNLGLRYGGVGIAWWGAVTNVPGSRLVLQGDGNLVIYSPAGKALWQSHTSGAGAGCVLTVQENRNVVLRNRAGVPIWQTHTA